MTISKTVRIADPTNEDVSVPILLLDQLVRKSYLQKRTSLSEESESGPGLPSDVPQTPGSKTSQGCCHQCARNLFEGPLPDQLRSYEKLLSTLLRRSQSFSSHYKKLHKNVEPFRENRFKISSLDKKDLKTFMHEYLKQKAKRKADTSIPRSGTPSEKSSLVRQKDKLEDIIYYKGDYGVPPPEQRKFIVGQSETKSKRSKRMKSLNKEKSASLISNKSNTLDKNRSSKRSKNKSERTVSSVSRKRRNSSNSGISSFSGISKRNRSNMSIKSSIILGKKFAIKKKLPAFVYKLSDLNFITEGITIPPPECVPVRIISFYCEPSNPDYYCFRNRSEKKAFFYTDGRAGVELECDGTGNIYYPNGEVAITLTAGRIGHKMVVYTRTEPHESGNKHDSLPVAIFDEKGNGVVFDLEGNKRLVYDQAEGILYDTYFKNPIRWQWKDSEAILLRRKDLENVPEDDADFVDIEKRRGRSQRKKRKNSNSPSLHSTVSPTGSTKKPIFKKKKGKKKNKVEKIGPVEPTLAESDPKISPTGSLKIDKSKLSSVSRKGTSRAKLLEARKGSRTRVLPPMGKILSAKPTLDIRPIVMRITENIGLRILSQDHIHVDFNCYPVHVTYVFPIIRIPLNIGVKVFPEKLDRIDKVRWTQRGAEKLPSYFDVLYKRSHSLCDLNALINTIKRSVHRQKFFSELKRAKSMGRHIYLEKIIASKNEIISCSLINS